VCTKQRVRTLMVVRDVMISSSSVIDSTVNQLGSSTLKKTPIMVPSSVKGSSSAAML